jgi:hypothetical protein
MSRIYRRRIWVLVLLIIGLPWAGCAAAEVVAWGDNGYSQLNVPNDLSNVVAIAAGAFQSLALTSEGRVMQWGSASAKVPGDLSNAVAISAGNFHSLALTAEGLVVAWGGNGGIPTIVPTGLSNVMSYVI